MRTHRLFQPGDYQLGDHLRLDKKASQHLIKVLRYREGDTLVVFNGKGNSFIAILDDASSGSATVIIEQNALENPESDLKIHIVLALSKGERMDYAIQKSVEAGVTDITPARGCTSPLAKPSERNGRHVGFTTWKPRVRWDKWWMNKKRKS